jgi:phosphate-selective porin OprO/OprP
MCAISSQYPEDAPCLSATRWQYQMAIALAIYLCAWACSPAWAQALPSSDATSAAGSDDLAERIEALERSFELFQQDKKNLDQPGEANKQKSASQKASPEPKKPADSEGWKVKLGGHIQMDYITWPNADPAITDAVNYFNYRRLRLVADGTGYDQLDFRLQMTLEPGDGLNVSPQATPDVKDAYLSMNEIPLIGRFRIGNFFVPFGLEQVTNDTNNIFNERSIPTQGVFTADREVGMAVYNATRDQNLSWAGGIFFHELSDTIKTRFRDSQGYRLSARLNWLPYYDEASKGRYVVHTGFGILHNHTFNDQVRFRARPQIQRGPILIDSGALAAGSNTTGNLELAIILGPVTLQHEAYVSQVNLENGSAAHVGGAYAHLSYFLTGESRAYDRFGQHGAQFGRNKPFRSFKAQSGSFSPGAWEAKIRWSLLDLTDVDAGQYNDLSAGFNWYWTDRVRIMFDWIRPYTTDQTVFGATQSDLFAMRLDLNW